MLCHSQSFLFSSKKSSVYSCWYSPKKIAPTKMLPKVIRENKRTISASTSYSSTSSATSDSSTSNGILKNDGNNRSSTKIIQASNGISYYYCDSKDAFEFPTEHPDDDQQRRTAEEVNQTLNLNLGLTTVDPNNPRLRKTLRFIINSCWWMEKLLIAIWTKTPLKFRHWLVLRAWMVYSSLHRILLGRSTGIHPDVSLEYHALTSICWWTRLFPVTIERMRFALNQLQVYHPPSPNIKTRTITITANSSADTTTTAGGRSSSSSNSATETDGTSSSGTISRNLDSYGVYISLRSASEEDDNPHASIKKVVFWIFGGGFLAGDVEGNLGCAEKIATQCDADAVFVANYRLAPEYDFQDISDDVYGAYNLLLNSYKVSPKNIIVHGISSGGGLAVNLMQRLVAEKKQDLLPTGVVLMCPFVDYTEPCGSMLHYTRHDLIVNQSVVETGFPYLESKLGSSEDRKKASPVYGKLEDLPPLLVVLSEHECCFDQGILLVNRAREANVDCTLGVWKYMCHVFPVLSPFIPEGKQAQDFMCEWMKSRFDATSTKGEK